MKLTKKLEKEVMEVYNAYWSGYMNGDIEAFAAFLDDDVKVIGSTEGEVFFNKKDALKFYQPTADQIAGKAELRNRIIKAEPAGDLVLITEQNDFYILIEDNWAFYAKGRLSTLLQKKDDGWKIIQQHGSMPDIRATEGEQFALEKISKENIELREAVKRRTIELENKNRELEIETSLERVRAVAMGMKKPDDILGICKIMFTELHTLGFSDLRNTLINFWDDAHDLLIDYDYSDYAGANKAKLAYSSHPVFTQFQKKIKRSKDAFAKLVVKKDELESWKQRRRESGEYEDPRLNNITALYYYFYSIGVGAIGISTFSSLTTEKLDLLKRFRNVFDFAYRRYMDVAQAEAQAKEAQIELALERVRARTMAMQRSDELQDTSLVLFQQLKELGEPAEQCTIGIIKESEGVVEISATLHGNKMQQTFRHKIDEPFVMNKIFRGWKDQQRTLVLELKEQELQKYNQYRNELVGTEKFPVKLLPGDRRIIHAAYFSKGMLALSTNEPRPAESLQLLERFAIVFEQTYTRFLDLQKAEAQAREAQIEASLERVRSRSMGMQKSEELKEVIKIVYQQLTHLKINLDHAGFVVDYTQGGDWHFWIADAQDIPSKITHPYFASVWANQFNEAKEKGADFFATNLNFEEKNKFYNELLSYVPGLSEVSKDFYLSCPGLAASTVLLENFGLYIENFSGTPYTDEENIMLMRFGKVFQQTYTRFLDLQKAEAQAKEAQIENALEKVRSRTMAMQRSEELPEAANNLFLQVQALGIPAWSAGYCIWDEDKQGITLWMSSEGVMQPSAHAPCTEDPSFIHMREAYERGSAFHVEEIGGEALGTHYQYMRTLPVVGEILDSIIAAGHPLPTFQIFHCVYFSQGFLLFITYETVPEAHTIFKRFTNVFEQTYTRFLDLQKAEAQTRESQIELGLERVRARAMAMQRSDELSELVDTVFKELTKLDFALTWCIINIIDEGSMSNTVWAANPDINKAPESYHMLFEDYPFHHAMMKGWKERKTKYVYVVEGLEKKVYDEYLFNETEFRKVPEAAQAASRAMERYVGSFSFSNFGGLQTVGDVPLSESNLDILSRFGKVFDLTYTRFNDLKQAEAQAREAKIETALEKVRAKTMAMQKSTDLGETSALLFAQLNALVPELWTCGFVLCDKNKTTDEWWLSGGSGFMPDLILPNVGDAMHNNIYRAWLNGESYYEEVITGEALQQHYEWLMTIPSAIAAFEALAAAGIKQPVWQQLSCSYFSKGYLVVITENPCGESQIFKRFAQVFEQTYTRFLDLQKAEAQAREATIEAALERTRTQSMVMQHSSELDDTLRVFHQQVLLLGIKSAFSFLWLPDEEKERHIFWAAWAENDLAVFKSKAIDYPLDRNEPATEQCLIDWKSDQPVHSYHVKPAEVENYFAVWKELLEGVEKLKPEYFSEGLHYVEAFMKYGCFGVMVENELSQEEKRILSRFAIEFERTYTRFLDLQKAEAQAREAQIETALERVRSRTMAMQRSEELLDVATVLFQQVKSLGVPQWNCGFNIWNIGDDKFTYYPGSPDGIISPSPCKISLTEYPVFMRFDESRKRGEELLVYEKEGEEQADHYRYMLSLPGVGDLLQSMLDAGFELPKFQIDHLANFAFGNLIFITYEHFPKMHDVFKRFAKVFEQTYTRFLDLQKAEAQAEQAEQDLIAIKDAKQKAEEALNELQSTQKQLIQSEKMASLGELTAGIAHEIQNPLNFVNNFSEVSTELIDEMNEEIAKGNLEDAAAIANDLKQNLEKINHHGKRAGDIVKGMLQHSRSSSATKEPTDINKLADEYLRLAYHGLRAKDKSFNATMKKDFDETIGDINIIPQDIGRVILNLFTNAFYVVNEKKNQNLEGYESTVTVKTLKTPPSGGRGAEVLISVKDNGNGIPQNILDKIFQPFFTTKPTGQGTGLGLSLSYDIVKAHGGELTVKTEESKSSEFIIILPL